MLKLTKGIVYNGQQTWRLVDSVTLEESALYTFREAVQIKLLESKGQLKGNFLKDKENEQQ